MTRGRAGALALAAGLTLGACGSTYVDTSVTVPVPAGNTTTTLPPIAADAPLADVLAEMADRMLGLDELIVDGSGQLAELARLEELWAVAEPQIRERDPDDVFPYEQAMQLARSGVERRRPADASKGYKVLIAAIDADADAR